MPLEVVIVMQVLALIAQIVAVAFQIRCAIRLNRDYERRRAILRRMRARARREGRGVDEVLALARVEPME